MSRSFAQETDRPGKGQPPAPGAVPVVLDRRDYAQHQFGLMLFMMSQGIPYFVLINMRFMVAGAYVPPHLDPWLGGLLPTLLMWAGAAFARRGALALRGDDAVRCARELTWTAVAGAAGLVVLMAPFWRRSFDPIGRFGTVYLSSLGVASFYTLVALTVVLGAIFRTRRGLVTRMAPWGARSAAAVWTFSAASWLVLYIVFYFI